MAAEKFEVSYDVNYEVKESGVTMVTQTGYIKNLVSDFYPTEYKTKFGELKIDNLKARDRLGSQKIIINGEEMVVKFNEKNVGVGKTYKWTLTYETRDLARKLGRVWEITLPKPAKPEELSEYNVTLTVPKSFGPPAYLKPPPKNSFSWPKDQIANSGIFAAFGDFQLYSYRLTYHLTNNSLIPVIEDIALIPTTAYQENYLESLEPAPWKIFKDFDGNWLARYILGPRGKLDVVASGAVSVFIKPRFFDKLPADNSYIQPQDYWESDDWVIASIGAKLVSAKNIYDYVVSSLSYDQSRLDAELDRLGAVVALAKPTEALCLEFTDLFVALARSAGIPARKIEGYAGTINGKRQPVTLRKDILHAWPQYYEKNNWRMVDPTWDKTTGGIDYFDVFDLNHIVFAIHGVDSSRPAPAGSYKESTDTKDVLINYRLELPAENYKLKESIIRPDAKQITAAAVLSGGLFLLLLAGRAFIHRKSKKS